MKYYLISLFLICANLHAFSQKTYLVGAIYDHENGTLVGKCKVSLLVNTKDKYYSTDSLGRFRFSMVCDKIDTLIIVKQGYCPLLVSNIDPLFVNSKNDLVFYLKKDNNIEGAFLSQNPKKILGITYKNVVEHDFFNFSPCCDQTDTSYYNGKVIDGLSKDLHHRCYYNIDYSEVLISTQNYYDNNPDSLYFPEFDCYAPMISLIDSSSPCRIYKDIDPYFDKKFRGGGTEYYAHYLKYVITKLNIAHEDTIIVDFVLEHPFGFGNINITGVSLQDKDKIIQLIEDGPKWSPSRSSAPSIRLWKQVIVDMTDTNKTD